MRHAHITKTPTNKTKVYWGNLNRRKYLHIFVQLGKKTKPWTGVAGAFVEHQDMFIISPPKAQESGGMSTVSRG